MTPTTRIVVCSLLLGGLTASGCDDLGTDPVDERAASHAETPPASWREAASSRAATLRSADPRLHDLARTLQPRRTRAGFLRFSTSAIHDPAVGAVFLERLASEVEPPEVRAALVEALPRTGVDYAAAVLDLLADEGDPRVRVAMIGSLRRTEGAPALEGLRTGLADADASVRTEAAIVAGALEDGASLERELVTTLEDPSPEARAAAVRTLGILRRAPDRIETLRADEDPRVRQAAERAALRVR